MHRKNQVLLLEKDLRKVLIKKGLEPELADICHEISDKYSIFVANILFFSRNFYLTDKETYIKNELYKQYIPTAIAFIEELFKNQEKPILPKKPNDISHVEAQELSNQLRYIKDWDSDVERTDKTDIKTLTWEQALEKAREYHREKAENALSSGLKAKSDQTYVMKFPDGSYWLNLKTKYCREEGDAMGHCGNASNGGILYSLRDKQGVPSITAEIDLPAKTANQIYGRGNSVPAEKYHERILQLIGKLNIQTVKVKDYGGKSLNVEEDISDELKEWFEEEYNYYPTTGGVTEKVWIITKERIDEELANLNHVSVYIDEDIDEHFEVAFVRPMINVEFPFLITDFWKTLPGKKLTEYIERFFNARDKNIDETVITFSSDPKPLNVSDADSLSESADDIISDLQELDENISGAVEDFIKNIAERDYDYLIKDYEDGDEVPKEWRELSSKFEFYKRAEDVFNYSSKFHTTWNFSRFINLEISRNVPIRHSSEKIQSLKQNIEDIITRSVENYNKNLDTIGLEKIPDSIIENLGIKVDLTTSETLSSPHYIEIKMTFPISRNISYEQVNWIFTNDVFIKIREQIEKLTELPKLENKSFKKFFYSYF